MKNLKELVLAFVLLVSVNSFAQDLNDWQKQKMNKELSEMTDVMELSDKQLKKITKIKTAQAIDADRIMTTITKGTPEAKAAWKAHGGKFNNQMKEVVGTEQWKAWTSRNKKGKSAQAKKPQTKKPQAGADALNEKTSKYIDAKGLNSYQSGKVTKEVAEMTKVMTLSQEQQLKVVDIKADQYKKSAKIMSDTKKGSAEQKQAWTALSKQVNIELKEATSPAQIKKWWAYKQK